MNDCGHSAAKRIIATAVLRYLQVRTLKVFIYYRILLGMVILALVFLHSGHARWRPRIP